MKEYDRKVVAITGASSGIGLECAKLFASNGWRVYNLSRHSCGMEDIIDIPTDVTDEGSVTAAFDRIKAESAGLGLLVNNAGIGISGAIEFTDTNEAKRQFDVNYFGALNCIKAALPMLKADSGRIICTSSAAAIFTIPFQSFYSASKASVNVLVNALSNELAPFGVSACALQLGDVKTGFTAVRTKSCRGDDVYGGAISRSVAVMEKDEKKGSDPSEIAKAIYKRAMKNKVKPIDTIGAKYKLFALLDKLLPNAAVNKIVGLIYMK